MIMIIACATLISRSVEKIIQAGIDPSTPTKSNGCSALHSAAVLEPPTGPEIVTRMLHHGADPNIKTPTGLSPLHIAAMWGRYQTINVLLDNGADLAVKDHDDMSPLDYAEEAEANKAQCIDALTRYRINCKRKIGGGFKSKTRVNLNKILGGNVELSTFLSDKQDDVEHGDIYALNLIDDDDEDGFSMNETLFQTCNEESVSNIVTSTMLEGPDPSDSLLTADVSTGEKPGLYIYIYCLKYKLVLYKYKI